MVSIQKKLRRCIEFIVVTIVIFALMTPVAFAASNSNVDIDKKIVQSILQQANEPGLSFESGDIVSMRENPEDKAFLVREPEKDGMVKITTIIPYIISSDGTLINSFNYFRNISVSSMSRSSGKKNVITPKVIYTVPVNFTDATVTTYTYEAAYQNGITWQWFYRHAGEEAKWNSNYSNVTIQNMYVVYNTVGQLYVYPDCLNTFYPQCIQDPYSIASIIAEASPAKNTIYYDYNHVMPMNRVVSIDDVWNDADYVYVELMYTDHNGTYHDYDVDFGLLTP